MLKYKKILKIIICYVAFTTIATTTYSAYKEYQKTTKNAHNIFGRWIRSQDVFETINLSLWTNLVDKHYIRHFRNTIPKDIYKQLEFTHFPFTLPHGQLRIKKERMFIKKVTSLIAELNKDFPSFVNNLVKSSFVNNNGYSKYKNLSDSKIRKKYKILLEALFYHKNKHIQKKALFTFANKLFEYAYNPKTAANFIKIASNKKYRPIIHLFHEGIWYYLARSGWHTWHKQTIKNLRKLARNNTEIVYLAGGTDIYQLIKNGIYNIRIIDPMIPSQNKYYSEGWAYLIKGNNNKGIGDNIIFKHDNIIMTRTSFNKIGKSINIKTSSKQQFILIPSTTTWTIKNKNGQNLGNVTIERRLVKQKDFNVNTNQTILMSLNELNFITTLKNNNWGIKPKLFPPSINIYIKQLSKPLTYAMLNNIQILQRIYNPFIFGSAVN